MANVLFTRTDNPDSREIIDGQVLFSTNGDGAIYLDNGTERMKIGEDAGKVDKTNVLSTVDECVASTDEDDVAGASVIKELQEGAISDVEDRLTANNVDFIFDYQNGKYGYNTSPNRGADTFFPFSKGTELLNNQSFGLSGSDQSVGQHNVTATNTYTFEDDYDGVYIVYGASSRFYFNNGNIGMSLDLKLNGVTVAPTIGSTSATGSHYNRLYCIYYLENVESGDNLTFTSKQNYGVPQSADNPTAYLPSGGGNITIFSA